MEDVKVWHCEDCGEEWEVDREFDSDICSQCSSGNTWHEHIVK